MAVIIKKTSKELETPPAGTHFAVCFGVAELGSHKTDFGLKPKLRLFFELSDELMSDGRPFVVGEAYNISLGRNKQGKAGRLLEVLEGWRGSKFTEKELESLDLSRLLGVGCMINVIHHTEGERTYANIGSISPLPKGAPRRTPVNTIFEYSIAERGANFPEGMFDWVKDKVRESPEFQSLGKSLPEAGGDPDYENSGDEDAVDPCPF